MAAKVRRVQTRYPGMLDKNMANRRRAAQRTEWRLHPDEDVPGRCVPWPTVAQVNRQRFGYRRQHGECEGNAGLWSHQLDRTGRPVDVLELQPDRFPGSKAVGAHHHQQEFIVAKAPCGGFVHRAQQSSHVLP